jgi:DNA primase
MTTAGSVDLERLKGMIPIEDLARELGLDVRGRQARCFNAGGHKNGDKNRSLGFDAKTNRFKCFACGKSGSVIDLYSEVKGVSIKQAIDELAGRSGDRGTGGYCKMQGRVMKNASTIAIRDTDRGPGVIGDGKKSAEIYKALKEFCGEPDKDSTVYLTGPNRGLTLETIKRFQIFSVKDYHGTDAYLKKTFPAEQLRQAGLVSEGGNFLFWKHKILVPFFRGERIVFLQGRTLLSDGPKYMHIKKPVPLFNVDTLKDMKPGERVYLCEGVFDAMILEQSGRKAVAILGVNNFKPGMVELFRGVEVVLCLDNDEAGSSGTKAIGDIFFQAGRGIKTKTLPAGVKDITEYFTQGGRS